MQIRSKLGATLEGGLILATPDYYKLQ